ncbi:hypothetical protein ERO13_A06G000200v2 [Gossypium hirsutum]|uniref:Elongator complex protein 5 isoform X2 n=1 Tax=Gossypium hirsutum TaxID=3635 RepID=A0ABM3BX92_GOSHI|nr:elongator complex protein 5 isoform X2 [Gossypium hirsutum]KAG4193617.1 hypothetical protein ERO13_A06G000200v2 [Gossypium hirsutum]
MFYLDLLKNKGTDVASSDKRIQILDCYSDPPGWKDQLAGSGNFTALPNEALVSSTANVFTEVKHMDKLYNSIIELGKGLVGGGNIRFSIAIDSKKKKVKYRQNPSGMLGHYFRDRQMWTLRSLISLKGKF